jgi:hypothetical protein
MSQLAEMLGITRSNDQGRPGATRSNHRPEEPKPARTVNACELAYAAREAVRDVLPAEWQTLPDGRDTATLLAGTLGNLYAEEQARQARLLEELALEQLTAHAPEEGH